jgi:hypothetical protein
MTTLVENPIPVIVFGIIAEAVLGVILLRSGRGVLLWAMAGVLAVVLAGVGLEWLVVTEREAVEATLESAAAAIGANDRGGVLVHVDPSATEVRRLVDWGFGQADFTDARITTLETESINHLTNPPTARVHVKGIVFFKDRRGENPYEKYLADLTVELRLKSNRWLITDCQWHEDPRGD